LPTIRWLAVECAPRSAPNSSLSISASGIGGAVDRHERAVGAGAVARDRLSQGGFAGTGRPGNQHGDLERRYLRRLPQHPRQRRRPSDQLGAAKPSPHLPRVIGRIRPLVLREQAIRQRRELPREELDAIAIRGGEAATATPPLEVGHADRRRADRRAQDRIDLMGPDAGQVFEPNVGPRRWGIDRPPLSHRPRNDSTRQRRADLGHVIIVTASAPPPRRAITITVQLEVGDLRSRDLDDQGQRLIEQRPELPLGPEIEQTAIERRLRGTPLGHVGRHPR
jgi:hypothetical protein